MNKFFDLSMQKQRNWESFDYHSIELEKSMNVWSAQEYWLFSEKGERTRWNVKWGGD